MKTVEWLLEEDTPAVAMLARRHLLDEDSDTRKMKSLRKRCNDYPPTAAILKRTNKAIAAGDYTKYTGAYWTFLILADLHADGCQYKVDRRSSYFWHRYNHR